MDQLTTERLVVRGWQLADAGDALSVYGAEKVTRWLTPVMGRVADEDSMRAVLQAWTEDQPNMLPPRGRWAVQLKNTGEVVGGVSVRLLPPYEEDLELSWQLKPAAFAVARPHNKRAILTAERLGMQWVGETDKYYDLRLQVFRIRPSDLLED